MLDLGRTSPGPDHSDEVDADIARVFGRRIGLLDSTNVLDSDTAMQMRIEAIFTGMLASPRTPPGPPKAQMLAIAQASVPV